MMRRRGKCSVSNTSLLVRLFTCQAHQDFAYLPFEMDCAKHSEKLMPCLMVRGHDMQAEDLHALDLSANSPSPHLTCEATNKAKMLQLHPKQFLMPQDRFSWD